MNWCILIPLLVGAICALLGYLLGRYLIGRKLDDCNDRVARLESDLEACKKARTTLESDLEACKKIRTTLGSDLDECRKTRTALESDLKQAKLVANAPKPTTNTNIENPGIVSSFTASANTDSAVAADAFDADAAKAVFGKKIKQDDLTVVEGIGPKIQELFHNHSVKTWKALSECSVDKCQEVLTSGGSRFKMHSPKTWPEQAKMAYEGRWADLLKWQDELDGGK